jgi:hypothetical protein
MEVSFLGVKELERLIDGLSPEDKEELATRLLKKLSPEARSRILGFEDSGFSVVSGSFVSLNAEVAINIQNNSNSNFDAEAVVRALLEYKDTKKQQGKT